MTEYGKAYEGKDWRLCLDNRQLKEVEFAEIYAQEFAHGTTGHNQLMVIYRMACMLSQADGMIAKLKGEALANAIKVVQPAAPKPAAEDIFWLKKGWSAAASHKFPHVWAALKNLGLPELPVVGTHEYADNAACVIEGWTSFQAGTKKPMPKPAWAEDLSEGDDDDWLNRGWEAFQYGYADDSVVYYAHSIGCLNPNKRQLELMSQGWIACASKGVEGNPKWLKE